MKTIAMAMLIALAPNVAAASGWFLALVTYPGEGGIAIAPRPYPTREACTAAGRGAIVPAGGPVSDFVCFPAPEQR